MTLKEILTELEVIEGQLDDAFYQLPEYNANEDTKTYLDGGRSDLYALKDSLEKFSRFQGKNNHIRFDEIENDSKNENQKNEL